jgi:hypothetical protein
MLDVSALDGMALLDDGYEAGGSFTLDSPARADGLVEVQDGWLVEVRAGSKVVVARGGQTESAEQAHARSIVAAQQGLDLLSIRGRGDLLIHGAVFDAYRNLYLALESILSTATPPNPREREADWIPRALRQAQAGGLDLAGFAPKGATDPVAAIVADLYSATRTATFHAKADKRTLLPLDSVDRSVVLDSLSRLARLYLELVLRTLGVRRPGGGMFKGGFDMFIGRGVKGLQVHVTDDPVRADRSQTVINPGGGRVRALVTRPAPELDQPFVATVMGEAKVEDLADLTHVARVVATTREGDALAYGQLEGHLTLGGFDEFQAVMGVRGLNVRTPRSFYDA